MQIPAPAPDMSWTPKKWIAVLLALFVQPLSMLYLARPLLALFYFLLASGIGLAEFWLAYTGKAPWLNYLSFSWLAIGACAIHSYRLAKAGELSMPRPWYSHWYGLIAVLALLSFGLIAVRCFFYETFKLPSSSMEPSLTKGSVFMVTKSGIGNYGTFGITILKTPMTAKIERGDVIVFRYPVDPKIDYVKRVVGLPGDAVSYKAKILLINGVKVQVSPQDENAGAKIIEERFGDKTWQTIINPSKEAHDFEGTVPAHNYFVLGDNRDNSLDSRYWGYVPEENILGKMVYAFTQ